jgi:hypothetical protein
MLTNNIPINNKTAEDHVPSSQTSRRSTPYSDEDDDPPPPPKPGNCGTCHKFWTNLIPAAPYTDECPWCYDDRYGFGLAPYPRVPDLPALTRLCCMCSDHNVSAFGDRCSSCWTTECIPNCGTCKTRFKKDRTTHLARTSEWYICMGCWFEENEAKFDLARFKANEEKPLGFDEERAKMLALKKQVFGEESEESK